MRKYWRTLQVMLQQITRDAMLFAALAAPVLTGIAIHYGIPVLETFLCRLLGKEQLLKPYYLLFDLGIAMITVVIFAFVGALVVLGETDDKIVGYMSVTPVGNKGYLFTRLGIPVIASFIIGTILLRIFSLTEITFGKSVIIVFFNVYSGMCTALLMVTISTNKVEGMAVGKLSGLVMMGAAVPFFVTTKVQYMAGILPSFWLGKYMISGSLPQLAASLLTGGIWIAFLMRKYINKIRSV